MKKILTTLALVTLTLPLAEARGSIPYKQPPEGLSKSITGKCNDGSFTQTSSKRGACSRHSGVAYWYTGRI